jgi:hypothetical protein
VPSRVLNRRQVAVAVFRGTDRGLKLVAEEIFSLSQATVSDEAVDEATLLKSGFVEKVQESTYRVGYTAAHAPPVEFGSRPHWPPLEPILGWVRRNVRARTGRFGGARVRIVRFKPGPLEAGLGRLRKDEQLRIAKAIQAKIARVGTEPVRFLTRARNAAAPRAGQVITAEIRAEMERLSLPGRSAGGAS